MLRSQTSGARAARYAVAVAVVAVLAAGAIFATSFLKFDRAEEEVAATFLEHLFAGDGRQAYTLTTPAYRSLVFPQELAVLSDALSDVAGERFDLTILGSERTPGAAPAESLVGYRARTSVGPVEGVVTLFQVDDEWRVADVGYDFTGASAEQLEELRSLTRQLNEQIAERARRLEATPNAAPSPGQ